MSYLIFICITLFLGCPGSRSAVLPPEDRLSGLEAPALIQGSTWFPYNDYDGYNYYSVYGAIVVVFKREQNKTKQSSFGKENTTLEKKKCKIGSG